MKKENIKNDDFAKSFIKLIKRSSEDDKFKLSLLNNPRSTFTEFFNGKFIIPEDVKVIVEDQSDNSTIYLNIPKEIDAEDVPLNDDQLELVAGGGEGQVIAFLLCLNPLIAAGYTTALIVDNLND